MSESEFVSLFTYVVLFLGMFVLCVIVNTYILMKSWPRWLKHLGRVLFSIICALAASCFCVYIIPDILAPWTLGFFALWGVFTVLMMMLSVFFTPVPSHSPQQ